MPHESQAPPAKPVISTPVSTLHKWSLGLGITVQIRPHPTVYLINIGLEEKRAVACGYWATYRYNPQLKEQGKNPFILDSKEPTESFRDYLLGEVRFASLQKVRPQLAEELYQKTEADAMERLANYKKLAGKE